MAKIGYCRVSTQEQNFDRQIEALTAEGCERIYQEKITGTHINRPELQRMLAEIQPGDIVVVKELTRISRSTKDMLQLVQEITDKGANIKSLNEGWLDTASPAGALLLTIFAGISQFENSLRAQRCGEGQRIAMEKGVKFGRTKVDTPQMRYALELYNKKELTVRKIAEVTGVSLATLMRRVKEMKEKEEGELYHEKNTI